jgi:2'-5' RNA ligase
MTTSDEETVRLFIAVNPGEEVRAELLRQQSRLTRELAGTAFKIKWVAPEAMHLTFFFLGTQSVECAAAVFQTLKKSVQNFPRFRMALAAAGYFGQPRAPRVLWVGLDAPPPLFNLQVQLTAALGIEEDKPFYPHLTLGRVKAGQGMEVFQWLKKAQVEPVAFEVTSIELIKSELTPAGARYTVLDSAPLAE